MRAEKCNLCVITEEPHYLFCEKCGKDSECQTNRSANLDGEGEALPSALFVARAVVVARSRLKSLPETDDDVADEHIDLVCNGDSGARGISTVVDRLNIERGRGNTCKSLTENCRYSRGDDCFVIGKVSADALYIDLYDGFSKQEEAEEDRKTHSLACHCGNSGASRSHTEAVDKDRVEDHIENSARCDPHHRKEGKSLASQSSVENEGRAVERCGDQNEARVGNGVRQHCIGASEKAEDGFKETKSDYGNDRSDKYRGCKSTRGVFVSRGVVLCAELAADKTSRADAETESKRLDDRHYREYHSDSR